MKPRAVHFEPSSVPEPVSHLHSLSAVKDRERVPARQSRKFGKTSRAKSSRLLVAMSRGIVAKGA